MNRWAWLQKRQKQTKNGHEQVKIHGTNVFFSSSLDSNLEQLQNILGNNPDIAIRRFYIDLYNVKAAVVFIKGLADKEQIHEQILKSIMLELQMRECYVKEDRATGSHIKEIIKDHVVTLTDVEENNKIEDCVMKVLNGDTALLIDNVDTSLLLGTKKWPSRQIEEPITEATVRGAREGFVENILVNMSLIRKRIRDPHLVLDKYTIGRRSQTPVIVAYIKDITNDSIIQEAKKRLEKIDIDQILESGIIEQFIEDDFLSPFPQLITTERPDKVASGLLEGRVAILVDGTPFVLLLPITITSILQGPEDYYERWFVGSLIRFMRFGAAFVSLFGPSLYVALVSYHPGLIPTDLVISIAGSREGVPFPTIVEALLMEITIEILREAGVRLPKPIGQTVGIVGGLVIGEAAVTAGLVSPMMVIVVAVTAISSFSLPQYGAAIAIRILRFGMMLSAAVLGLFGIIMFAMALTIHLVKLKSFGVDYTSPFVPYQFKDWKDAILRLPYSVLKERPEMLKPKDSTRMK
ncbi:spore germination protein [Cytobacillus oceanisediminis]|uniref:spore germination protein n=1 Tax=Cytobacillus oceanisediminis TaxID=665099 RepID=UPI001FB25515|nr:spore germination protein [Cytobacillus oceanisediminis]UOE54900.1 spore germination protein [Cytobacillus oceanisediminis]